MKKLCSLGIIFILTLPAFGQLANFDTPPGTSVWASSSLTETLKSGKITYGPEALFDNNTGTPWVEGAEGFGTGQTVTILIQGAVTGMTVVNGFAGSEYLFKINSRIRTVKISFLAGLTAPGMVTEMDWQRYLVKEFPIEAIIELEDTMDPQEIGIPLEPEAQFQFFTEAVRIFRQEEPGLFGMILLEMGIPPAEAEDPYNMMVLMDTFGFFALRLTIDSVYQGSKYSDTCISEIKLQIQPFL